MNAVLIVSFQLKTVKHYILASNTFLSVVPSSGNSGGGSSSPSVSSSKKFFLSTDRLKAFAADAAHKLKKDSNANDSQGELQRRKTIDSYEIRSSLISPYKFKQLESYESSGYPLQMGV